MQNVVGPPEAAHFSPKITALGVVLCCVLEMIVDTNLHCTCTCTCKFGTAGWEVYIMH